MRPDRLPGVARRITTHRPPETELSYRYDGLSQLGDGLGTVRGGDGARGGRLRHDALEDVGPNHLTRLAFVLGLAMMIHEVSRKAILSAFRCKEFVMAAVVEVVEVVEVVLIMDQADLANALHCESA